MVVHIPHVGMLIIKPRKYYIAYHIFKHMSFWHLFMGPHLPTYHSSIGLQLRYVIK